MINKGEIKQEKNPGCPADVEVCKRDYYYLSWQVLNNPSIYKEKFITNNVGPYDITTV